MGQWSGFDLGELYLFSRVSKGKCIAVRRQLAGSVDAYVHVLGTGGFSDVDINFFFFPWSSSYVMCKPCCTVVHSLQGSVQLRLVLRASLLLVPNATLLQTGGMRNLSEQVPPPCCPLVGSSEVLHLDLPAWVVKMNVQCLFFSSHLEGKIPRALSLWICAGIGNLLFRE